ncbi:MAG: hypothetical protein NUV34_08955 [Sulfuricaulis sp.]|nr:hypothetical protein [Sulfuricaulis sp.]
MRVLVVSQNFWPEGFRINELVSELVNRGHTVTVLTGEPNYPGGKLFPEYVRNERNFLAYHGARIVRVPIIPRGKRRCTLLLNYASFAISATVVGVFRLRGDSFDAIFVFQTSPVTAGLPAIALRGLFGWPWRSGYSISGRKRSPLSAS